MSISAVSAPHSVFAVAIWLPMLAFGSLGCSYSSSDTGELANAGARSSVEVVRVMLDVKHMDGYIEAPSYLSRCNIDVDSNAWVLALRAYGRALGDARWKSYKSPWIKNAVLWNLNEPIYDIGNVVYAATSAVVRANDPNPQNAIKIQTVQLRNSAAILSVWLKVPRDVDEHLRDVFEELGSELSLDFALAAAELNGQIEQAVALENAFALINADPKPDHAEFMESSTEKLLREGIDPRVSACRSRIKVWSPDSADHIDIELQSTCEEIRASKITCADSHFSNLPRVVAISYETFKTMSPDGESFATHAYIDSCTHPANSLAATTVKIIAK